MNTLKKIWNKKAVNETKNKNIKTQIKQHENNTWKTWKHETLKKTETNEKTWKREKTNTMKT